MTNLRTLETAIVSGADNYPANPPFDPPEEFPELPFKSRPLDRANRVYPMVREALRLLGMDIAHFGSPTWNPFGELIAPGEQVLIKPNFVLDRNAGRGPIEAVVTHASVLRALADYVLIALHGKGTLVIGDAPQMNCDLKTLFSKNGMDGLLPFLADVCARMGVLFSVVDFREEQTFYRAGIVWKRKSLRLAPEKTVTVVLGRESFMDPIDNNLLYGADYDRQQTTQAHKNHRHEYKIAAEVLASDVVISVPKLKVHSKVGTTLNIKNMVGINTEKNHLAHYRVGPKEGRGDEFSNPRWYDNLDRRLSDVLLGRLWKWGKYPFLGWRVLRKLLVSMQPPPNDAFAYGNWYGNDTAWRMALDLNRIVLMADSKGQLHESPVRRYFSLIDGIVGGQGNGPLHPDAFPSHVVIAGFNPLAVDWVATALMGFDPARIPMYANGVHPMREALPDFDLKDVTVRSNLARHERVLTSDTPIFQFASAPGWRGAIERYESQAECSGVRADHILQ